MRIALIADTFPPLRSSGAVQIRDLSREFARQGHSLCVLLPASDQSEPWRLEEFFGLQVLRLKAPKAKDIGYVRRTLAELAMPLYMLWNFRKSPFSKERWEGVVWYSPSIFLGPFANWLKRASGCKGYLIVRDVFPEWAVDMGLMCRGLPYRFFNAVARYQYSVADVIGVQSPGNCHYFNDWQQPGRKLEVLQNWLATADSTRCSIRLSETTLSNRKVFVYAGNMGVAQGMDIILELAQNLLVRSDVGFLMVGRGSDADRLKKEAQNRRLSNILFFDEIHPDEIPDLYAQCQIGIVLLDPRHRSHNIPGKFLTYIQSGLPVLANVNAGNDLATMIRQENVGQVCESNQLEDLATLAEMLLAQIDSDPTLSDRCRNLFKRNFSANRAIEQIVAALSST